ncbi:hypothetical protein RAM_16425 [Amycolatopsis mediterranei S699]|uniref:Uncharacterized protein n=1 Tax=Amycolatopsis mediterranei (strain S699) TaxID=713604 RepID=A0A9R0U8L5_AMYMS|nr:hypothetical protein RAM_16425 [Amycolatopsis mediterranei S699]
MTRWSSRQASAAGEAPVREASSAAVASPCSASPRVAATRTAMGVARSASARID